jgi:hypothetical protein
MADLLRSGENPRNVKLLVNCISVVVLGTSSLKVDVSLHAPGLFCQIGKVYRKRSNLVG